MQDTTIVLLAGGQGRRMQSDIPKVLHTLCGRTMLDWALKAVGGIGTGGKPVVVLHDNFAAVEEEYGDTLTYVAQSTPSGSGGALYAALPHITTPRVVVVAADLPLLQKESLCALSKLESALAFFTAKLTGPKGYGRVARKDGAVAAIVEEENLSEEQAHIQEVRVSAYAFETGILKETLNVLFEENELGEILMSDVVNRLLQSGVYADTFPICAEEAMGVNDRVQLASCTALLRRRINHGHMLRGVTFLDPHATYIDDAVKIGRDSTVYPGVVLEGNTRIGEGTTLYPGCRIQDSHIGSHCTLQGVVAREAVVQDYVTAGPYVHLRPNARIGGKVKIGNYIEVKNSTVREGAKLPHLSYIGDSDIGKGVNMGCGSVTVNYDGFTKHRTVVEDEAFIGCHTSLVAPVRVGKGSFTAAGSVITEDVPPDTLAIARVRQVNKIDYVAKLKEKHGEG